MLDQRELRFDFQADGSFHARNQMPAYLCDKTPEGSLYVLNKVLDPLDPDYLPPLPNSVSPQLATSSIEAKLS